MFRISKILITIAAFVFCLVSFTLAQADTVNFNFEEQNQTVPPFPRTGALTTIIMGRGSLVAYLSRADFEPFDIIDNSGPRAKGPEFGLRSLDPFFDLNGGPFIVGFSQPVDSVSIDMGDYGVDTDSLMLEALEVGTREVIDLDTGSLPALPGNPFSFSTLTVTGGPGRIIAVRFSGSGISSNSVFYDNLRVNFNSPVVIPEPATMILLGTGLAGVSAAVRKRRTTRSVNEDFSANLPDGLHQTSTPPGERLC